MILVAALAAAMTSPADFADHYGRGRFARTAHQTLASDAIADAVFANQLSILLIEMPPQHGKSAIVSQWAPAWFLSLFPERNVGLASYEAGVAVRWGRWVRDTITEIGTTAIKQDSQAADEWLTEAGGGMKSVGVGGPLTSHSVHLGIVDDPIKNAEEADSEVMREKVWNWFLTVMWTRKQPGTVFVVMHTRWHEDDLVGRILAHPAMSKLVRRVTLPALAEDNDPLGRAEGEALWPERYPADDSPDGLLTTREVLPTRWWNALFQQRPTAAEGAEIKRHWWQWYDELPVPREQLEYVAASWDCTFKDHDRADWVVGQVWGVYGTYRYLLDQIRARIGFVETANAIVATHERWRPNVSLVELAANGDAIVQSLQSVVPAIVGVSVQGKGSKVARARAITPIIEGGQVYLPRGRKFADDLVEESAGFPLGKHDDQVDAMSQALAHLRGFQSTPLTHLRPSDERFVGPHILQLQQRGVVLGGLGRAPRSWRL